LEDYVEEVDVTVYGTFLEFLTRKSFVEADFVLYKVGMMGVVVVVVVAVSKEQN
jgi:hypothetical protein